MMGCIARPAFTQERCALRRARSRLSAVNRLGSDVYGHGRGATVVAVKSQKCMIDKTSGKRGMSV
jgi:hypothetical protein